MPSPAAAVDIEGIAEDLALYTLGGRACGLKPHARLDELGAELRRRDREAFERGAVRGVTMFKRLETVGKSKLCSGVKKSRDKADSNLDATVAALLDDADGDASTLEPTSSGGDYMAASQGVRLDWTARSAALVAADRPALERVALAAALERCLTTMMTADKHTEAVAVAMFQAQPLADLTVLCVGMLDGG